MLSGGRGEGFVCTLQDSLGADVDPASCSHLAVHHQARAIELVELVPIAPMTYEVGIAQQNSGCVLMSSKNANGFAGLHQQSFIICEGSQGLDDGVEAIPISRRAPGPAVNDQVFRLLGYVRIQIVQEHSKGGFLLPAPAGDFHSTGSPEWPARLARVGCYSREFGRAHVKTAP